MIYPLIIYQFAIEHCPFIVDLPINSMVIFHSYVRLPEGISHMNILNIGPLHFLHCISPIFGVCFFHFALGKGFFGMSFSHWSAD